MPENVNQNTAQNKKQNKKQNINTGNRQVVNSMIRKQINDWLSTEPYRDLLHYVQSRVMGQEEVSSVVANVYNYLRRISIPVPCMQNQSRNNANNMLLCAPSGCGKTETYRAIKDYFSECIPLLIIQIVDVSNITPTGFRGPEPSSIVEPFAVSGSEPIGIVFMDEFDKICTPSYTADHADIHLDVQHNILTMIEGANVETRHGFVDTRNLLFIGAGSFDEFRKVRELEGKADIGFQKSANEEKRHCAPVTRADMITSGGCYELIGRFSYIVNYHPLDRETVIHIIERDRKLIEYDFGCDLILGKQVLDVLCEQADSKFGCRLLDSLIREPVLKAYGDAMQSDICGDILEITLNDLDTYSYTFRDYEPSEIRKPMMEPVSNDEDVLYNMERLMNFEEVLASLLGRARG